MISQVKKTFDEYLYKVLKTKPEIYKVVNQHQLKEKAIERTCEEVEKSNSILHVVDKSSFDQIVEMAANLYAVRLLETLEHNSKTDAEKYRIKKEFEKEKRIQDAVDNDKPIDEDVIYG